MKRDLGQACSQQPREPPADVLAALAPAPASRSGPVLSWLLCAHPSRPSLGISLLSCCLLSLQEVKATASSKVMLGWLKNSQEASPKKKENELPRWTSQFIPSPSPKKSSAGILQQWLGKEGEPAAKKRKA